ncbi:alcohol dehydrogenase catalytic domain-containing protein [Phycisphaera mikurensis]|uniref:Putative zinc-containing alcohol dehydrogenase n=1 Tax=Phycisphaera mikurensis (strain NBRC 102666 / KCTC 22515 / FYK2301M01) TaxID=1142394 RepID=I0IG60_PHYMF|nr:alcohol dehydrogenase catalytic domain-containing protein [Phycisphaera mikurensis]MBB6440369.1 Zn-dependent alcohol dehydrogenase [Phycisphaera mikurensis]BAM04248.1 putative zinc-containing alcohol dehydrogenase [Phycisphaera mikurensis NBRC 102666]
MLPAPIDAHETFSALVADGRGGHAVRTIEVGPPGPGELAVDLRASGICHTDFDSLSWGHPHVMGHEGAGVVAAAGEGVTGFAPGDRVLLNWAVPCLACGACRHGHRNLCERQNPATTPPGSPTTGAAHAAATRLGGEPLERSFHLGTMSGRTVVREAAAVRIPDGHDISWGAACIIGCGVMTGFGSAVKAGEVRAGDRCVVLGCGGVGLSAVQGCRIAGASRVVAVDLFDARLEMARAFGATDTIRAERDDAGLAGVAAQVRALFAGEGADVAVECTAVPALGAAPLAMVRNGGTAVQASGIEEEITVDMRLFEWDKTYRNPLYGGCDPAVDLPRLLELHRGGKLLLEEMVSRSYALEELDEAFADMRSGAIAKGVILFGD